MRCFTQEIVTDGAFVPSTEWEHCNLSICFVFVEFDKCHMLSHAENVSHAVTYCHMLSVSHKKRLVFGTRTIVRQSLVSRLKCASTKASANHWNPINIFFKIELPTFVDVTAPSNAPQ